MKNYRVVGETIFNYDPRSLSLDPRPTKAVLTCEPMTEKEASQHLLRCMEAAPTWRFKMENVSA